MYTSQIVIGDSSILFMLCDNIDSDPVQTVQDDVREMTSGGTERMDFRYLWKKSPISSIVIDRIIVLQGSMIWHFSCLLQRWEQFWGVNQVVWMESAFRRKKE